jgi:hypothetical protein
VSASGLHKPTTYIHVCPAHKLVIDIHMQTCILVSGRKRRTTNMRTQRITIVLELKPGQEPYKMEEKPGYVAIEHFFEDIDFKVFHWKNKVGTETLEKKV